MLKKLMDWQLPLSFSDIRRLPSDEVLTLSVSQKELDGQAKKEAPFD